MGRGTPGHAGGGLVGRDDEVETLVGAWQRVCESGRATTVVVRGPAGIGKTALVRHLTDQVVDDGGAVAWGRCWTGAARPPLWPWRQIVHALERDADGEWVRFDDADEHGGGWIRFDPPPTRSDPARAVAWVTGVLDGSIRRGPTLVVIDDLHWADRTSVEVLHVAARSFTDHPVLFVATHRPGDTQLAGLDAAISRLEREGEVVDLGPLDARAVNELADRHDQPARADEVARVGGGHPFFTLELLRSGGQLPASVRELVGEQLGLLPDPVRAVLEAASVHGSEVALDVLVHQTSTGASALASLLRPAVDLGLITLGDATVAPTSSRSSSIPRSSATLRFSHAIVADAIVDRLDDADCRRHHLRIARVLGADRGSDPSVVLAHLAGAGDLAEPSEIARVARAASSEALDRGAHSVAADHLGVLVDALRRRRPSPTEIGHALADQADALTAAGRHEEADAVVDAAIAIAREHDDHRLLALAALAVPPAPGSIEISGLRSPRQAVLRAEALERFPPDDDPLRVRLLGGLATARYWDDLTGLRGPDHAATEAERDRVTAEAVAMARRLHDPPTLARAISDRIAARWGPAGDDERPTLAEELFALAATSGDVDAEMTARQMRIMHLLRTRQVTRASSEVEAFSRRADELHHPLHRWTVARWEATLAMLHGRLDEAEAAAGRAVQVGAPMLGDDVAGQFLTPVLATVRYLQHRFDELGPVALELARSMPDVPAWWSGVAQWGTQGGPPDVANEAIDRLVADDLALVPRDVNWITTLVLVADAAFRLGRPDATAAVEPHLTPYRQQFAILGSGYSYFGPIDRALGLCAAARGDLAAALDLLAAARDQTEGTGDPQHLLATVDLAVVSHRAGRHDAAEAMARRAVTGFDRAGIERWIPHVRTMLDDEAVAETVHLVRSGRSWRLTTPRGEWELAHLKGIDVLRAVLARPDAELGALDVVALIEGATVIEAAVPVADDEAVEHYRQRVGVLRDELELADLRGDAAASERAATELDALEAELRRTVGLDGRTRRDHGSTERARVMLTKQLRRVIERIGSVDPVLGDHLTATISTGSVVSYRTAGSDRVRWVLEVDEPALPPA